MKRYAIYYAPRQGPFAQAAAAWLGYDVAKARDVVQPQIAGLPRRLADLTADPYKYGFHGTLKAPFRLADGVGVTDLMQALRLVASQSRQVQLAGLQIVNLEGFLAFVPKGDPDEVTDLAAEIVRSLDPYRAALNESEIARRNPDALTPRQRDLLAVYGYPYVMEEFRFHLTLTGRLPAAEHVSVSDAAHTHFAGVVPQPFVLADLCLMGENTQGRFQLLHRYPLAD